MPTVDHWVKTDKKIVDKDIKTGDAKADRISVEQRGWQEKDNQH